MAKTAIRLPLEIRSLKESWVSDELHTSELFCVSLRHIRGEVVQSNRARLRRAVAKDGFAERCGPEKVLELAHGPGPGHDGWSQRYRLDRGRHGYLPPAPVRALGVRTLRGNFCVREQEALDCRRDAGPAAICRSAAARTRRTPSASRVL